MKYRIGFSLSGAINVDADDEQDAIEIAEQFSKIELAKYGSELKFNYVENKQTKEKISL